MARELVVKVVRITPWEVVDWAYSQTTPDQKPVHIPRAAAYLSEHSPIVERVFYLECVWVDVVHTHMARHSKFARHYVGTHRPDRGFQGKQTAVRSHAMAINAMSLIDISRRRLCYRAKPVTRQAMEAIRAAVAEVDPELARMMVPNCVYRRIGCPEGAGCCGRQAEQLEKYNDYLTLGGGCD